MFNDMDIPMPVYNDPVAMKKLEKDIDDEAYEKNRALFRKVVEDIQDFEKNLNQDQELHAIVNGIEFCIEKISLVRVRFGVLSALLVLSGVRPNGEIFRHVQPLRHLNISLLSSHKKDAKELRRELVIEEDSDKDT